MRPPAHKLPYWRSETKRGVLSLWADPALLWRSDWPWWKRAAGRLAAFIIEHIQEGGE